MRLITTINRSTGPRAKIYRDTDYNEYRVKFYDEDGQHLQYADYHTDCKDDAHDTAHAQLDRMVYTLQD
jgi:hypothetical protein